jgi:Ca2+-binding EF-hand superfamily protein
MVRFCVLILFAGVASAGLTGCGMGAAVAPTQTKPSEYASLAPRTASATPVRIPDAPKPISSPRSATPPVVKKTDSPTNSRPGPNAQQDQPPQSKERQQARENRDNRETRKERGGFGRNDKSGGEAKDFFGRRRGGNVQGRPDRNDASSARKDSGNTDTQNAKAPPASASSADKGETASDTPSATTITTTSPSTTTPSSPNSTTPGGAFNVTFGSSQGSSRSYKKATLPAGIPSWFSDNDNDGDGQLTMNEWPPSRTDEFRKYDRNTDGIITTDEAMRTVPKPAAPAVAASGAPATGTTTPATNAAPPTPTAAAPAPVAASPSGAVTLAVAPGNRGAGATPGAPLSDDDAKRRVDMSFQYVDDNKDGFLDSREISEKAFSFRNLEWKKYDTNSDSKLDRPELTALMKAEGNNMRGGGRGGPGGGPGGGNWGDPDAMAKTMFNNMDKKKTGKLAREDFPSFWASRFDEFDSNKDGVVDFEEFKAGSARMRGGRGGRDGGGGNNGGGGREGRGGERGNGGFNGGAREGMGGARNFRPGGA